MSRQLGDVCSQLIEKSNAVVTESEETSGIPLNTSWTFWIDRTTRGATAAEFVEGMKKVYTVSTVESFWSVYNNIPEVHELRDKYSYHLMREDTPPLWEDPRNRNGGTWRLKVSKKDCAFVWKELLLAAIGEQFSNDISKGDEICGVSVTVRDKDVIVQVWNVNARLAEESTVLNKIHQLAQGVRFQTEFYKPHFAHHAYEGQK